MKKLIALLLIIAGALTTGAVTPTYGWIDCNCYQIYVGTANIPFKVAASNCTNNGHPKPANCK